MKRKSNRIKRNRTAVKAAAILTGLLLSFAGALALLHAWEENMDSVRVPAADSASPDEEIVYYKGAWYQPKKELETVLAIGVDQAADGALRREQAYEQSDFLLLLVIDRTKKSCTAIHVNRDAMAEIRVLDDDTNEFLGTMAAQLSLAHTFGNSPAARCRNTADAVSGLLCGIKIDHYISLTMDGVVRLNDLAGGVTVEVMDDLSELDSGLAPGKTVRLQGRQALTYVQARMGLENPSNLRRMERQRQYLEALQVQLRSCMEADETFAASALLELSAYLTSDCSVEKMSGLADLVEEYGVAEYRILEGTAAAGEKYVEYHVDEAAARDMVMELFYERAETD